MVNARRLFALLFVLVCLRGTAWAQRHEQLSAEHALGPQWKQLSRAAGIVFAGTVLRVEASPFDAAQPIPTMQLTFRVDLPIAGVDAQQELTIREWTGAWESHRPMRVGERFLLFFYPPSPLGLTSPVGGQAGQFPIDSLGRILPPKTVPLPTGPGMRPPVRTPASAQHSMTVRQLARTIRSAREE
jgi:hypothetical protein